MGWLLRLAYKVSDDELRVDKASSRVWIVLAPHLTEAEVIEKVERLYPRQHAHHEWLAEAILPEDHGVYTTA